MTESLFGPHISPISIAEEGWPSITRHVYWLDYMAFGIRFAYADQPTIPSDELIKLNGIERARKVGVFYRDLLEK